MTALVIEEVNGPVVRSADEHIVTIDRECVDRCIMTTDITQKRAVRTLNRKTPT